MEYIILEGYNPTVLTNKVREKLHRGYTLRGDVIYADRRFCQVVIKE